MSNVLILIVDDDPEVRATLATALGQRGCRIETAGNGAEALDILETVRPALVLLDMHMPVLDGWGFARKLQTDGVHVPLLIMSEDPAAESVARDLGAAGFIPKPVDKSRLLKAICPPISDRSTPPTPVV
jgi:two-component system chemotaxis response regulator CheY